MDGVVRVRPGLARLAPLLLALAIPAVVLGGAGVKAAVARLFAPRPVYGSPPSAVAPLMAWDGARKQVVMVTGVGGDPSADSFPISTTWTWDGSGWTPHTQGDQPPVGTNFPAVAAYDPALREVVAVVTAAGNPTAVSTWAWDGRRWHGLAGGTSIAARDPALAYDDAHGQLLLTGTNARDSGRVDTWVLHGSDWDLLLGAMQAAEGPVHLAFDRSSHRLLLVPGYTPPPPPAPTTPSCGMVLVQPGGAEVVSPCGDPATIRVAPCQGCSVAPLAWSGATWKPSGTTARTGTVLADPAGDGLLDVVASDDKSRGVWRWDGRHWTRVAGLPLTSAAHDWQVAPDPDAGQLVLYGGELSNGGWQPESRPLDQTWTLEGGGWTRRAGHPVPKLPPPATPPPPPACSAGTGPSLHADPTPDGSLFLTVSLPATGPPGDCTTVPGSLRLETRGGRLLAVTGNPANLAPPGQLASAFASASWENWCGSRAGAVIRLTGPGFDLRQPVAAFPACHSSRMASTLTLLRMAGEV